jgi:hypothetical protein
MEKTYVKMETIRGTRYAIKLTKEVKGIPGFAPEWKTRNVGEVVYYFPHGNPKPYLQFFGEPPTLEIEDIKELAVLLRQKPKKDLFNYEKDEED